jgi:hypothetical protein
MVELGVNNKLERNACGGVIWHTVPTCVEEKYEIIESTVFADQL